MVPHRSLSNSTLPILGLALVLAVTLPSCGHGAERPGQQRGGGRRGRTAPAPLAHRPRRRAARLESKGGHGALVAGPGEGLPGRPGAGNAAHTRDPAHPEDQAGDAGP